MAPSVLILGGGLAGVACAHKLGDEGVPVTLVDRKRLSPGSAVAVPGRQFATARRGYRQAASGDQRLPSGDRRHRACGSRQPG